MFPSGSEGNDLGNRQEETVMKIHTNKRETKELRN
jgi:hypothetical protein